MTSERQRTGREGEDLAARYLEREGCRVVARNYRCPLGELDLVVEGPEGIVFVEVRTKRQPCTVRPEETITRPKALRLARLAEWYMATTKQEERPWRVDLIAVELGTGDRVRRLQWFRDVTSGFVSHGYP
jgi:putative endonuclease